MPWKNDTTTKADDYAHVIESLSMAVLRLSPMVLILAAMVMAAHAYGENAESLLQLAEKVAIGALGSLTTTAAERKIQRTFGRTVSDPYESRFNPSVEQRSEPSVTRRGP